MTSSNMNPPSITLGASSRGSGISGNKYGYVNRHISQSDYILEHCHPELKFANKFILKASLTIDNNEMNDLFVSSTGCVRLDYTVVAYDHSFDLSFVKKLQNHKIIQSDVIVISLVDRSGDNIDYIKSIVIDNYIFNEAKMNMDYTSAETLNIDIMLSAHDYTILDYKPLSK